MSSRRTLVLALAALIGVIAAFLVWRYVDDVEQRAYDDARLVEVFKVVKDVPKGLPGEQALSEGYVKKDTIPAEYRPGNALTKRDAIRGKVALTDLSAGQPLVDGQFVDPRIAQVTFAQRIPAGQVAITMAISGEDAVGSLLVPGDRVNIIVTDPNAPDGTKRFLFQNVRVLAIGAVAAPQPGDTEEVGADAEGETVDAGLITFAVPPLAAEKLDFVGPENMRLVLVPPDNQPQEVPPVNAGNLFDGDLTPYPEEG